MADEIITSSTLVIEKILQAPCPSCGAKLAYSAEKKTIYCAYCNYSKEVDKANDQIQEKSLAEYLKSIVNYVPEKDEKKLFECKNCGARSMVDMDLPKIKCTFCGSDNVNEEAFEHKLVLPQGILPFKIPKAQSEQAFKSWITKGWFHPNDLKKLANIDALKGIYIPFWTYDAQTDSTYEGEAGFYYYETQTVWVNGKPQTQQVRKIRWEYRSGSISQFFDDVAVTASKAVSQDWASKILPYELTDVVNFDKSLLLGWEAEVYSVPPEIGWNTAEQIMDEQIKAICIQKMGGDTYRNLRVQTFKSKQTFKHIILPLWLCSYQYKNKQYHFSINGQTGKIDGTKPLSIYKIMLVILLILLLVAGLWFIQGNSS